MTNSKGKMDRLCAFLVRHRLAVLLVVLGITLVFCYGARNIRSEVLLYELFPYDHPYLKLHAKFSKVFGTGASGAVIMVKVKEGDIFNEKTLTKIKDMTREIEMWDEVYRLHTISLASMTVKVPKTGALGEIRFESLMFPHVAKTEKEINELKSNIFSSPSLNGKLVSYDGTAALLTTMFKEEVSYEEAFKLLQAYEARYSDANTEIHMIGYPMLMGWIHSYRYQIAVVVGISVVLMILILYVIFRNLVGMIAPIALAMICTALGLGFVGWTGLNFNPLLLVLAFLVGARMVSNAVQITHRYIEEYQLRMDSKTATYETMRSMWMPNAAAVVTDAAGFLVLILAKIVLMQMIAIMMSFWMLTIVLSGMLVPIICSFLPPVALDDIKKKRENGWLSRKLGGVVNFSVGNGRYVVGVLVILFVVVGIWQTTKLKVGDATPGTPILWPDHPYNQAQGLMNRLFRASSDNFVLYYEGEEPESVYEPEVVVTFEKFDNHMSRILPDIYKSSSSIIDMGKTYQLTFREGDQVFYQLPRHEENLAGLMGQLTAKVGAGSAQRFMDAPEPARRAQLTIYFADHTSDNMMRIRQAAYDFFKDHPMETEKGRFLLAGGRIGLEIALNEEMKSAHASMDTAVLVTIFFMCSLAFRSFLAGAMLAVPLILSNLMAFAYMAASNIGLSTNTLPCSAVGVGVGVDFAIYLYSRCREEFPEHSSYKETVLTAVRTAGSAIVFTGITLILPIITWYFISGLKFQAQMGFFLAMLLLINMISALTLHPLLILLIKPKFLARRAGSRQVTEASVN